VKIGVRRRRHGQNMLSRRQKSVVAVTLYDVRHVSAVDLEIDTDVPSEIRCSQNYQMPGGSSSGAAQGDREDENENYEELPQVICQSRHTVILARIFFSVADSITELHALAICPRSASMQ